MPHWHKSWSCRLSDNISMSHISEFKIVKTALWKVSGSRPSCLATTLFVCDTLRCNAMTPDCDVTHFDWQLQCSACFNSFLSGDSTATPWENCRSPDTHTQTHRLHTHSHTLTHTHTHRPHTELQTSSVSLRCLLAAVEADGHVCPIPHQTSVWLQERMQEHKHTLQKWNVLMVNQQSFSAFSYSKHLTCTTNNLFQTWYVPPNLWMKLSKS